MQGYGPIPATAKLKESLALLLANDGAAISNNSGTAFPTENLAVGMSCWREDLQLMHTLVSTNPVTWVANNFLPRGGIVGDTNTGWAGVDNPTLRVVDTYSATGGGLAIESFQPLIKFIDRTAGAQNTRLIHNSGAIYLANDTAGDGVWKSGAIGFHADGYMSIGGALSANAHLYVRGVSQGTSTTQWGAYLIQELNEYCTGTGYGIASAPRVKDAVFTMDTLYNVLAGTPTVGAQASLKYYHALGAADYTNANATRIEGLYLRMSAAANKWNIFAEGTASNFLNGKLLVGSTADDGNKLQVTGTVSFDTPAALDNSRRGATTEYVLGNTYALRAALGNAVDLNTITATGIYHQPVTDQAASGANYPVKLAGKLEVYAAQAMVYQTYHEYNNGAVWYRSKYNTTWFPWKKVSTGDDVSSRVAKSGDTMTGPLYLRPPSSFGEIFLKCRQFNGDVILRGADNADGGLEIINSAYNAVLARFLNNGHFQVIGDIRTGKDSVDNFVLTTMAGTIEMSRPEGPFIDFKRGGWQDFEWRLTEAGDAGSMRLQTPGGGDVFIFNGDGNIHCATRGWLWDAINGKVNVSDHAWLTRSTMAIAFQNRDIGSVALGGNGGPNPSQPGSWVYTGTAHNSVYLWVRVG